MGDGIKFIEDSVAANQSVNGSTRNAFKILILDVDSSDLRYFFSISPSIIWVAVFFYQTVYSKWTDVKLMVLPKALGCLAHQKTLSKILSF